LYLLFTLARSSIHTKSVEKHRSTNNGLEQVTHVACTDKTNSYGWMALDHAPRLYNVFLEVFALCIDKNVVLGQVKIGVVLSRFFVAIITLGKIYFETTYFSLGFPFSLPKCTVVL